MLQTDAKSNPFLSYTFPQKAVATDAKMAVHWYRKNNPKVMRVVSAVWLMTCILLPIFVMIESYTNDAYVSFQLIAFYVMWAFIMLVPFFKYHFVDKNRGDK